MNMVGILLAGGKSTRMQQDKALLPWADSDLLTSQYQKLKSILVDDTDKIYVSGYRPEFNCVVDLQSGLGPLEGVRSVCRQLKSLQVSVLIMPIDMPLLSEAILKKFVLEFYIIQAAHNKFEASHNNAKASYNYLTTDLTNNLDGDPKINSASEFLFKFKNYELPIIFNNAAILLQAIEHLKEQKHKRFSFKELGLYFQNYLFDNSSLNPDIFLNTNTLEDWNAALSKTNVAF